MLDRILNTPLKLFSGQILLKKKPTFKKNAKIFGKSAISAVDFINMCFVLGASRSTDADKVVKFIVDSYSLNLAHNVDLFDIS